MLGVETASNGECKYCQVASIVKSEILHNCKYCASLVVEVGTVNK